MSHMIAVGRLAKLQSVERFGRAFHPNVSLEHFAFCVCLGKQTHLGAGRSISFGASLESKVCYIIICSETIRWTRWAFNLQRKSGSRQTAFHWKVSNGSLWKVSQAYENSSQETQMKTSMLSFNFLRNSHASSSTSIYARMPIVNSMNSIHKAVSVVQRFPLAIRQNWIPRLYFGFLLPGLETIERWSGKINKNRHTEGTQKWSRHRKLKKFLKNIFLRKTRSARYLLNAIWTLNLEESLKGKF